MSTGNIKFFNKDKGFGFITPEDGTADMFVHISQLDREDYPEGTVPQENDLVSYEVTEGKKGPMAVNVKKA